MDPDETDKNELDALFDAAILLPSDERDEFLKRIESEKLRNDLVSLLNADQSLEDSAFLVSRPSHDASVDSTLNQLRRMKSEDEIPENIGRYQIRSLLGKGGFGSVYLAHDPDLDRSVAIKVPHIELFERGISVDSFVEEARSSARLEHPALVSVYDVQKDGDRFYIVQQFIDGSSLSEWIRTTSADVKSAVQKVVEISEAVGVLHQNGLVHRDLKPSNILVDQNARIYIADFGLALQESSRRDRVGEITGTPAYMSPEQVKGETHLIDGRSDVWAIGVILYELLLGVRPFTGSSSHHIFDHIKTSEPKPPRQLRPDTPSELQRICLKCLEKRRSHRYQSTADLVDDLQSWLNQSVPSTSAGTVTSQEPSTPAPHSGHDASPDSSRSESNIVLKGLRAFDEQDAGFFLDLLPGARDRTGLPESLRFWKSRIEQSDPDHTFKVGLIYGPSGCGKSSLIKAGLLPRIDIHVRHVYVEATPDETERRLAKKLQKHIPSIPSDMSLSSTIRHLRERTTGGKVLIVLDQFEQWLHSHADDPSSELLDALRHCDGAHVQCIVLVRDDFWMAISRFMRNLEVPLVEGENSQAVDLLPQRHAEHVLAAFGKGCGAIPGDDDSASEMHEQFIAESVAALAEDARVICVKLTLFAEMMKNRPWTPSELRNVGGTMGVGITFLEETFVASTAPPLHRVHRKAASAVLKRLLPEFGSDIKGNMRSTEELLEASGYDDRPNDFEELMRILDKELRLVTPTDPDGHDWNEDGVESPDKRKQFYQLTHDFLVNPIREWLTQKLKETRSGRAKLLLDERSSLWKTSRESRYLPDVWEFAKIRAFTRASDWNESQHAMMRSTRNYYLGWVTAIVALIAVTVWGVREIVMKKNATAFANTLVNANEDNVLFAINDLQPYLPWAVGQLETTAGSVPKSDDDRGPLNSQLALVSTDKDQVYVLVEAFLDRTTTPYARTILSKLSQYQDEITDEFWNELHDEDNTEDRRFRAGIALSKFDATSAKWTDKDHRFLAEQLLSEPINDQRNWLDFLEPISVKCIPVWKDLFTSTAAEVRLGAANIIAEVAKEDLGLVGELLSIADATQYRILYPLIKDGSDSALLETLARTAGQMPSDELTSLDRIPFGKKRAGAGVTLARLGKYESALQTLKMDDDPEALTQFIHRCNPRGILPSQLVELLEAAISKSDASLGNVDRGSFDRMRYAILLALGDFELDEFDESGQVKLINKLSDWYRTDPSSAVHSATGWLLRRWGRDEVVAKVDQTPIPYANDREWFNLNATLPGDNKKFNYTFIVFPSGEYSIGSVRDELNRDPEPRKEGRHSVRISRPFALLDREITYAEMKAFDNSLVTRMTLYKAGEKKTDRSAPGPNWEDSVKFCNWLSGFLGLATDQHAYNEFTLDLSRPGIRLPTEAEWETACRSGCVRTSHAHGSDSELLQHYAWFAGNSKKDLYPPKRLRPSLRGFFDIHGNLFEWCHDWVGPYPLDEDTKVDYTGRPKGMKRALRGGCWGVSPDLCRASNRMAHTPNVDFLFMGLRPAMTLGQN